MVNKTKIHSFTHKIIYKPFWLVRKCLPSVGSSVGATIDRGVWGGEKIFTTLTSV